MAIDNKRPHTASTGTAQENTIDKQHSTKPDPLQGWYSLAAGVKPSRTERTPKRSWTRGKQRGRIDAYLLAQLVTLAVIVVLIAGGLNHE